MNAVTDRDRKAPSMKAWSLWQPWASAWLSPIKLHETRSWELHHRGDLLVHATKGMVKDCGVDLDDLLIEQFGPLWRSELPRGALIGVVQVIDCRPTADVTPEHSDRIAGDFAPGRFAIARAPAFKVFKEPIPWSGRQKNTFNVPYEAVQAAIESAA